MRHPGVDSGPIVTRGRAIASVGLLFGVLAITGEIGWVRTGGALFGRAALLGLPVAISGVLLLVASGGLSRRPVPGLSRSAVAVTVAGCALVALFLLLSLSTH